MDLSQLLPGESAYIEAIDGEVSFKRRMMDIGLIVGVSVEMVKYAPLGDPVQISLRGSDVIIRKEDAQNVKISKKEKR